ncbi:MAG: MaoC family dehydratase [Chloroflexi bacterium]|nr:MaoC family dehydratase [Chloroflexota bacterium]
MAKKYFEEIEVGTAWETPTRTVTEQDIRDFCHLIGNIEPLHLDREYIKKSTQFRDIIAPGTMTFGIINVLISQGRDTYDLGMLGIEDMRYPNPVYPGDTLRARCEIIGKRETSKPDRGVVKARYVGYKQDGSVVAELTRAQMVRRRPATP